LTLLLRQGADVDLDPSVLSNDERMRLNDEAAENLDDEVMIDIRYGYVGGEYPLHGKFRLRSFSNVIGFLGQAMGEDPEYDVPRDPRTRRRARIRPSPSR
jgi:hypothetical protein